MGEKRVVNTRWTQERNHSPSWRSSTRTVLGHGVRARDPTSCLIATPDATPLRRMQADMKEIASEVFSDFYTFFDKRIEPTHFVNWIERLLNRDPNLRV